MDWKVEVERLVATKVEESRVLEFERQLDLASIHRWGGCEVGRVSA